MKFLISSLKLNSKLALILISLCSLFSCGKKVQSSKSDNGDVTKRPGLEAGDVSLKMKFDQDQVVNNLAIELPNDAWVTPPVGIEVLSGTPAHFTINIHFNEDDQVALNDFRNTYCQYIYSFNAESLNDETLEKYHFHFKGCYADVDDDGKPDYLNYEPGVDEIFQKRGSKIRLELVNGFTPQPAEIITVLEVDWI